jgi:hypothetical protein
MTQLKINKNVNSATLNILQNISSTEDRDVGAAPYYLPNFNKIDKVCEVIMCVLLYYLLNKLFRFKEIFLSLWTQLKDQSVVSNIFVKTSRFVLS